MFKAQKGSKDIVKMYLHKIKVEPSDGTWIILMMSLLAFWALTGVVALLSMLV